MYNPVNLSIRSFILSPIRFHQDILPNIRITSKGFAKTKTKQSAKEVNMLNVLFRTFIVYIAVLFIVRVMGKGELSKLDPFQIVILFMMAELAALPIETPEISIIAGLTALLSLLLLQVIFSLLSLKSRTFKNLVNGKASIIIEKGRVNIHEMKRLRMTLDELSQQLRLKNYPSINDIDYAIIEANGDMSIIPNPNKSPASREDLNISYKEKKCPYINRRWNISRQHELFKYK